MPTQLTFILLFVAVLALIGVGAWLVRRFASNRLGSNTNRGRMPRLAVIDAAAVDGRRRLVLVRRDNVEHLLMIGGPSDIVVEPNIVRATPQRDQPQQRGPVGTELPQRVAPLPDPGHWTETISDAADFEQMPPELTRAGRSSFADDIRRQPPPAGERRAVDPLAALAPEMRTEASTRRPPPRSGELPKQHSLSPSLESVTKAPPVRAHERPGLPSTASAADQNLAEMAQRLEAALRRPGGEFPATDHRAPPVAPESPYRSAPRPANELRDVPSSKTSFENLEDEMASLLGRPKTPT